MATDKPRYSITVDDELFDQIEDFRFNNRFQSRNKATVELIRLGFEALKKQEKADQQQNKE
jgi:metal-responsive CopG/Arc/MetJ family transcriptional regulator